MLALTNAIIFVSSQMGTPIVEWAAAAAIVERVAMHQHFRAPFET